MIQLLQKNIILEQLKNKLIEAHTLCVALEEELDGYNYYERAADNIEEALDYINQ